MQRGDCERAIRAAVVELVRLTGAIPMNEPVRTGVEGTWEGALPTGEVTFLFTNIEGSTRLWEQHAEARRLTLARHDALLHAAIEAHQGHVFKTMGNAFCVAFASAHRKGRG
jgi:class 3 adenylate cyclase